MERLKGWCRDASGRPPPPARQALKRVTRERVDLHARVASPGENVPVHVEPFEIPDEVPEDEEIRDAVRRLRNNRSGGRTERCRWYRQRHRWERKRNWIGSSSTPNGLEALDCLESCRIGTSSVKEIPNPYENWWEGSKLNGVTICPEIGPKPGSFRLTLLFCMCFSFRRFLTYNLNVHSLQYDEVTPNEYM